MLVLIRHPFVLVVCFFFLFLVSASDTKCTGSCEENEATKSHLSFQLGGSIPFGSTSTSCHKHPQQEVKYYCENCQEVFCSECAIENHSGHNVVKLTTVTEQFKDDISAFINKVKDYDLPLSQAIKETTNVLSALKGEGKLTEEYVHGVFDRLRLQLDEREAEVIGEIDQEMHRREKELMIQKGDQEFLLKGGRDLVEFGDRLVREGSGLEIVASHQPVIVRFQTLENGVKKTPLIPVVDEKIEFLGAEEAKMLITGIGTIFLKGVISAEKSRVVRNERWNEVLLGRKYSFKLMVVDEKGNKLSGTGPLGGIQVEIDGPSREVKVDIVEQPGDDEGISFKLTDVGDHEISILFRGRHFQGSPFKLNVFEKPVVQPVYRRDYGLGGDQAVVRFGSQGNGDGQFYYPTGVACNLKGEIIVVDRFNYRIQVFDRTGRFLFEFGSRRQFEYPCGVAVDHYNHNQIVVVDRYKHRIQIFDEWGRFLRSFGSGGYGDGQFNTPFGVAVDQSNGDYLVADSWNHRVQIFDSAGVFIRKFGSEGDGNGQFNLPWGIGLLSNGNIVVSEHSGNRLQIFDSTGNFIREIPGLDRPCHLFVDSDDNILVAENGGNQIQVFNKDGNQVRTIGKGQLSDPEGVCMDDQGRIIVAEQKGHRISIF